MGLVRQIRPLFFVSLAIAVIGFCGPVISSGFVAGIDFDTAARASLFFSIAWAVLFIIAVVQYRSVGLWLLIGSPLAMFYPLAYFMIWWNCAQNASACR